MPHRRRRITALAPDARSSKVKLWILRALVMLDGHREFITPDGIERFSLARFVGMDHWLEPQAGKLDWLAARRELAALHKTAERERGDVDLPSSLATNLARLAIAMDLSEVDRRILEFVVHLKTEQALEDATTFIGQLSSVRVIKALAIMLDLEKDAVRAALRSQSILAKSGLLKLESGLSGTLDAQLELLSTDFAEHLVSFETDPLDLIKGSVARCSPPHLVMGDYDHIVSALTVLRPYLRQSLADGRKGVNIFLYGRPGTGKTQLARVLALELGCELFEIACEDGDGDSIDGEKRLRAFGAAQCLFVGRRTFLLFDEVEDVFADGEGFVGRRSIAQQRKAWMNRTLEENPVPTIWISNSHALDPAFMRRFDMIFEIPVPPRSKRERITREACLDLLTENAIERIADSEALAPALITRASSVVKSIRHELDTLEIGPAVEFLISSTLQAQGHAPIRKPSAIRTAVYDPAFIQADTDVSQLTQGLAKAKAGRLCLYGPPGTGKTAFAHWLVEQIDIPLIVKRGSDLISPFVGQSERNIAALFREAKQTQSALLIDEVDSFLQDRRSAQRTWEISLVNEMLVQIEEFAGIFVASTNAMDSLDQAVLRRFDMKVRFDFLKPEQAWRLVVRYCSFLNISPPARHLKDRLQRLPDLTLGDFAMIDRQHLFNPINSAEAILNALDKEYSFKQEARSRIGFL